MILDAELKIAEGFDLQANSPAATDFLLPDSIDLLQNRNLGGRDLRFLFRCTETVAGTSNPDLVWQIIAGASPAGASPFVLVQSTAFGNATHTGGAVPLFPGTAGPPTDIGPMYELTLPWAFWGTLLDENPVLGFARRYLLINRHNPAGAGTFTQGIFDIWLTTTTSHYGRRYPAGTDT